MRYIKIFEEYNSKYYVEISHSQYFDGVDETPFSEREIDKISGYIRDLSIRIGVNVEKPVNWYMDIIHHINNDGIKVSALILKKIGNSTIGNSIDVYKCFDDYYLVRIITKMADKIWYFKCDTIDGVKELFSDMEEYLIFENKV
jgi:hypothetical protein